MPNAYPPDLRREARRLWLTGRYTDEAIATKLEISRADTVRDWRTQEAWVEIGRDVSAVVEQEVAARVRAEHGAFRSKYDQLGQVIENLAVRALRDPRLSPRDLKATAGTIEIAQRIRDRALTVEPSKGSPNVVTTLADIIKANHARRLGRSGGVAAQPAAPSDPAPKAAEGDAESGSASVA